MGKVIALVPARAGSTRVKDKNIRQIKGMPLIGIAVKQALEVPEIDEVFVSTDSELYAQIAEVYGAVRPFLRPADISGNQSTDYEVFRHFYDWYVEEYQEIPELIVQVRATAPARDKNSISQAIKFMKEHKEFDSLRSVSSPHQTPYKMWKMKTSCELVPVIEAIPQAYDMPTQDLPVCYGQDGIVDIVRPKTLTQYENMGGKKIAGFLEHPQTWDIDTEEDLRRAGVLLGGMGILGLDTNERALGGSLGIIQGRLTPADILQCFPVDWASEFEKARMKKYSAIECFRDKSYNKSNPLWAGSLGMEMMRAFSFHQGIGIRSVCDDYVQNCEWKSLGVKDYLLLEEILLRSYALGADIVVFPMFEKADLNIPGNYECFLAYIERLGIFAEKLSIRIALEISENEKWLTDLFEKIPNKNVGLCVDTGNLYAAGINATDIILCEKLRDRIFHIHIKDRNEQGENVVLGHGKVDFVSVLKALYEIEYEGTLVTETARGDCPEDTAEYNRAFLQEIIRDNCKKVHQNI